MDRRLTNVVAASRPRRLWAVLLGFLLFSGTVARPAPCFAEEDELLPEWLQLQAEYRIRSRTLNPFELSGTSVEAAAWSDQRLRLDLGFVHPGLGGLHLQADFLDGVLLGDNGQFGGEPASSSGLSLASQQPNAAIWEVGLPPGGDPLNPDSYVPVLRNANLMEINKIYGEVNLPVGLLRIGRQTYNEGAAISSHDGGRRNRWGVSQYTHTADRVLFATKLDEAIKAAFGIRGRDMTRDNGIFLIGAYDWGTQDEIQLREDDLNQYLGSLQFKKARARWFGWDWRDLLFSTSLVYRTSTQFQTEVFGIPFRLASGVGPVEVDLQLSMLRGSTREISDGISLLTGQTPQVQDLDALGAHAQVDVEVGPAVLTLQVDYATGDADPRGTNAMTTFNFARDFNVGLLLFEHILAFESARSAAVGIENLSQIDATSFPLDEIQSDGRFNNALAFFPQVTLNLVDSPRHKLRTRTGVLMAWPDVGVVDPIMSILYKDGDQISDDLVNYHGGKPGSYYGTEFDQQLEWTFADLFIWTLEGAVLFPGDGLQDEHGDAVTAFFVENRFTVLF